jgi:hypothetical protein
MVSVIVIVVTLEFLHHFQILTVKDDVMDKYLDQAGFISGRIHAMKLRLDKAMRRVERNSTNTVEAERAKRLYKLITLHETNPDEAMLLYNKE